MLVRKTSIPSGEWKFLAWTNNLLIGLLPLAEKLGYPPADYELLVALKNTFATALNTANTAATRTSGTIQAKNDAHKALDKAVRQFLREYITYNHALTNQERQDLELPLHDGTRTPILPPTTSPKFNIEVKGIGHLRIHFQDEDSDSKAKPYGVNGAVVIYDVLPEPPETMAQLTRNVLATRTPFTLDFTEKERGQRAWIALCWQNEKGEKGPWTEALSAIIP
jgi:hypothetical protein